MKARNLFGVLMVIMSSLMTSCGTMMSMSSSSRVQDDLYGTHDKAGIAKAIAEENARLQSELESQQRRAEQLEAALAAARQNNSVQAESVNINPYQAVLSDNYEESYARRLAASKSASYNMPDSYYSLITDSRLNYATAYDPSTYNIIILGDDVWVEPKYITAMFGSWGRPRASLSFGFGWDFYPYWDWSWGYSWDWRWRYGWTSWYPYYGWNYYWGFAPHHHHHYRPWWGYYPPKYNRHNTIYGRPYIAGNNYMGGGNRNSGVSVGRNPLNGTGTSGGYTGGYRRPGATGSSSSSNSGYRNSSSSSSSSSSTGGVYRRPTASSDGYYTGKIKDDRKKEQEASYSNESSSNSSQNGAYRRSSTVRNNNNNYNYNRSSSASSNRGTSSSSSSSSRSGGTYRRR